MPQDFQPYKDPNLDGRRKVDPKDYQEIRKDYEEVGSYRQVAFMWGISKTMVRYICQPETWKKKKEEEKASKKHVQYYDKAKHRLAMQKYRDKKRQLGVPLKKPAPL